MTAARLARHATLAAIRQAMDAHPVDRGDYWLEKPRTTERLRVRCGEPAVQPSDARAEMPSQDRCSPYTRVGLCD